MRIAIPIFEQAKNYEKALQDGGAEPVIVTEPPEAEAFDGLLLPGGEDVNPALYHQENQGSVAINDALDSLQLETLRRFVKARKPVLGICRGMQLLNVAFGGTLIQDLPTRSLHAKKNSPDTDKRHSVEAEEGSDFLQMFGSRFLCNSSHHQAVDLPGEQLKIVARCPEDGVAEALIHESLPILGVQFHPERMRGSFADGKLADGDWIFSLFLQLCEKGCKTSVKRL